MALRTEIVERTNEEVLLMSVDKKFRPAHASYPAVPAGTHVVTVALTTDVRLSDAQMTQLETAIGNITGVGVAFVLSQGPTNGVPSVPEGYRVDLGVTTQFAISRAAS